MAGPPNHQPDQISILAARHSDSAKALFDLVETAASRQYSLRTGRL
ncbi:hypothetical protein [Xylophilus sp.]|nr:hypothetical protein [Xylophilus sp.]